MTISNDTFILMVCSIMTGLIVEGIKKIIHLDKPNITAAFVSVIVGVAVPLAYIIVNKIVLDTATILHIISIVVLSWLCAMLGFDKVMQTIGQIKRG